MKKTLIALTALFAASLFAAATGLAPDNPPVHGDYIRSNGSTIEIKTKDKKGDVSGSLLFVGVTGQTIQVAITDVTVIDGSAYIHGIVIFDSLGVTTGRHSYHRVIDRPGDDPDEASPFINLVSAVPDKVAYLNGFATAAVTGHIHVAHNP